MKIYCCFTPAHEILYKDYFLKTVPKLFEVVPTSVEILGSGDYFSPEFLRCINSKIELVIESIKINDGEVIIWSDVDIVFYDISPDSIREQLRDNDLLFQREGHKTSEVNTGFIIMKCNNKTLDFFETVRSGLNNNHDVNEQFIVNELITSKEITASWGYLSFDYYARTHGWPPPLKISLYHANFTIGKNGIKQKLEQFHECNYLRRYPILAHFILSFKYASRCAKKRLFLLAKEN